LQEKLTKQRQVLSLKENPYGAFAYRDEIIIDNNMKRFTEKNGIWRANETEHNGRFQMNYAINNTHNGTFIFKPFLEKAGLYELSIWYPSKTTYSEAVQIYIRHKNGIQQHILNQKKDGGKWIILGNYEFESGYQKLLTMVADDTNGSVVADAIKLGFINY